MAPSNLFQEEVKPNSRIKNLLRIALESNNCLSSGLRDALTEAEFETQVPTCDRVPFSPASVCAFTDDSLSDDSSTHGKTVTFEESEEDRAFFACDLGEVATQFHQWRSLLPRISPWYAVKCNPTREIVSSLISEGIEGLDCASKAEVELALDSGVPPSSIIYANPCKPPAHLRFAREKGVTLMTFDNEDELLKIRNIHPHARLVLRVLVDDSKSICQFGVKFGARLEICPTLLALAKSLGLDVVGVSFHVGSGCKDASAFRDAVERASEVFAMGAEAGYKFELLDCGGGFPGAENAQYTGDVTFADIAKVLGAAVDEFFPDRDAVKVIAEPGRYFVSSAMTLAAQVTSKRVIRGSSENSYMYYINDGVYGSFNCIIFDHYVVCPKVLTQKGRVYGQTDSEGVSGGKGGISSLWGPTCDSMDLIMKSVMLPELEIGDWLCFPNMGAYTAAAASAFNGFAPSKIVYINSHKTYDAQKTCESASRKNPDYINSRAKR